MVDETIDPATQHIISKSVRFLLYLCQTSHEGNKCRTKAKELLRAFCPNIHTVISYFIRWERRLPSSGLLNTTTSFGSLVGIVFPKAIKTGIILFVYFKDGYRGLPWFPLCLTDVSVFAEIPKVKNSLCTITVVWE